MSALDPETLQQLVPVFVHDLRNPLAALLANLEFAASVLRGGEADPDVLDAIGDSQVACELLRLLIDNLNAAGARSGAPGAAVETAVGKICEEVVRRAEIRAEHAGLALTLDDGGGPRVRIDGALVSLALENLLGNAIQHAPRGSAVTVRVARAGNELRVEVRDGGGAVPAELRAAATSAEGQIKTQRAAAARYSRGAGLMVARLAAERCGGRLELGGEGADSVMAVVVALPA
jgi:signal transduction histidine kinase